MKVILPSASLKTALTTLTTATGPGNPNVPEESALVIDITEDQRATLSAVSKGHLVTATYTGKLTGAAPGHLAVPREAFTKMVDVLTGDNVEIEVAAGRAKVRSGTASFTLATLADVTAPPAPEKESLTLLATVSGADLTRVLGQLRTAAPSDAVHSAIRITRADAANLRLVTTDGYRMVSCLVPTTGDADPFTRLLLPFRTIAQGLMYLASRHDSVEMLGDGRSVVFRAGHTVMRVREIEVSFPDVEELETKWNFEQGVVFDRTRLIDVIDRVATASDALRVVPRLVVNVQADRLDLRLMDPENKESVASDLCPAAGTVPEGTTFAVNSAFLRAALAAGKGSTAKIEYLGDLKPLRISAEHDGYYAIVQPMR